MSTSSVNDQILLLRNIAKIFDGYVMLVLVIIGSIGNLLNIFIFLRFKSLRQMSNTVFLVGSFIGSLALLWASQIPRCVLTITGIDLHAISAVYCKIPWLFGRFGLNMPFTCLCLSGIDRFLCTSRRANFRRIMTRKRALIIVIIVSLAYLIMFIPDVVYYSDPGCTASANARARFSVFVNYFNLYVTNVVSMCVLLLFGFLTWYNLYIGKQQTRFTQIQKQVTRMMVIEFLMIFITMLPNFIWNIYDEITQYQVKSQLRIAQETLWRNINVCLSFTLHVGRFFIYMLVSGAFRQYAHGALCCKNYNQVGTTHVSLHGRTATN